MKKVAGKNLIYIGLAVLVVCVIIVLAYFAHLEKSKYVHIVSEIGIAQGTPENNTEMESVKVHGAFWNDGNLVAKDLSATVIFSDPANNRVVRKKVPVGGDLPPNKRSVMTFDLDYLREKTTPKTEVKVTIEYVWMENGQPKSISTLSGTPLPVPESNKNNLSMDYNGWQIELTKGQTFNVTLEANPSTGYSWEVVEINNNILRQIGEPGYQPIYNFTGVGAPEMQIFRFEAIGTGRTTLGLVYRRPWEKDIAPLNNFSVELVVR